MSKPIPFPISGGRYVYDGDELVQVEAPTAPPVPKSQRPAEAAGEAAAPEAPAEPE